MHPLVVISYNNHAYVENTVVQAEKFGLQTIVIDNASTYEKTRCSLKEIGHKARVIHLADNVGYTCWTRPEIYDQLPARFFLTDPDLQWNAQLPVDFPSRLDSLCSTFGTNKIGFALDLSDSVDMYQDADYYQQRSIRNWEAQFWTKRIEHPSYALYEAALDTTFHLFDKHALGGLQMRVAGDFTARHLPWYRTTAISPHDLVHMYASSKASTISKLVLRAMIRKDVLKGAIDMCTRTCSVPIQVTAAEIEAWVR